MTARTTIRSLILALILGSTIGAMPAIANDDRQLRAMIVGKWDVFATGCTKTFYEYRSDGKTRNARKHEDGTWEISPTYPAGRFSIQDGVLISELERPDGRFVVSLRQSVRPTETGGLLRRDLSRVLIDKSDNSRLELNRRVKTLKRCPSEAVAGADDEVETALIQLRRRVDENREFERLHERAAQFRDNLLAELSNFSALSTGGRPIRSVQSHEVPVRAVEIGYRLVFPDLTVQDGSREWRLGDFALLYAFEGANRIALTVSTPERLQYLRHGKLRSRVTFGHRRFHGVWDNRMNGLTDLDLEVSDVNLTERNVPFARIGRISVSARSDFNGADFVDLQSSMQIDEVTVRDEFSVGQVEVASTIGSLNIPAYRGYQALAKDDDLRKAVSKLGYRSDQEVYSRIGNRLEELGRPFDQYAFAVRAKNVAFREGKLYAGPVKNGQISSAQFGVYLDHLEAPTSEVRLEFGLSGLQHPDDRVPLSLRRLLPEVVSLNVAVEQLPMSRLASIFTDFMVRGPSERKIGATLGGLRAAYQLMRNQTKIVVKEVHVDGPVTGLDGEGEARIDPQSPRLASGHAVLTIRGLEDVLKSSREAGAAPGTIAAIALLMAFGDKAPDHPSHEYRVDVGPTGEVTLNGRSIGPLIDAVSEL